MEVKVKFRYNRATGQVEMFEIDDQNSMLPAAEHNREHERIAAEIGRVVERNPHVIEVLPGIGAVPASQPTRKPDAEDAHDTQEILPGDERREERSQ